MRLPRPAPLVIGALALLATTPPATAQFRKYIYPAPTAALSVEGLPAGTERFAVTTADGLTLAGLRHAASAGKPTLLVFHGNASSAMTTIDWFAPLIAAGYGVVAAEYRSYSGNPGTPNEAGLTHDADAFYAAARSHAGGGRVIVVGHSLGSGVGFGLAQRQRLDGLVTIGGFTGIRPLAPRIVRGLIGDRYDNLAAVRTLDEPYFLIHGLQDDVVPAVHGKQLGEAAEAAGVSGVAFFLTEADHHPSSARIAALIPTIISYCDGGDPPMLADTRTFRFGRFAARTR